MMRKILEKDSACSVLQFNIVDLLYIDREVSGVDAGQKYEEF